MSRGVGWRHSCLATLLRARRAVGGGRVCPSPDYSRLARDRAYSRYQEKRTRRAPLRGHVLVVYTAVPQQQQQPQQQSVTLRNPKYEDRLTLAHSPRLFVARPDAVSLGSDAWVLRAVQGTQRVARPQQPLVSAFARSYARTINMIFQHRKTVSICQVHT